jgi:U3 small nucleolar RNA-associated protein 12
MLKKLKRKKKRAREKSSTKPENEGINNADEVSRALEGETQEKTEQNIEFELMNDFPSRFQYTSSIHFKKKMRSLLLMPPSKTYKNQLLVNSSNNYVDMYTYEIDDKKNFTYTVSQNFDKQSHHSGIRTLSVSSDDNLIITGSADSVKVWNSENFQCIRTFESSTF